MFKPRPLNNGNWEGTTGAGPDEPEELLLLIVLAACCVTSPAATDAAWAAINSRRHVAGVSNLRSQGWSSAGGDKFPFLKSARKTRFVKLAVAIRSSNCNRLLHIKKNKWNVRNYVKINWLKFLLEKICHNFLLLPISKYLFCWVLKHLKTLKSVKN